MLPLKTRDSWTTPATAASVRRAPLRNSIHLPQPALLGMIGAMVCGVLIWLFIALAHPSSPPVSVPTTVPAASVNGPMGQVTLHDWPDGRSWLTFYRTNRAWVGLPLWSDRPWHTWASCTAFEQAIMCLNVGARTSAGEWQLVGMRLGTQAMLNAALQPVAGAQPGDLVNAYLTSLARQRVDTLYRFGLPQSPVLTIGALQEQYYERALFQWPKSCIQVACIRQAPLGQWAVSQGW